MTLVIAILVLIASEPPLRITTLPDLNVSEKASYITPVPGGIGPMTVYELMNNVYEAHQMRKKGF